MTKLKQIKEFLQAARGLKLLELVSAEALLPHGASEQRAAHLRLAKTRVDVVLSVEQTFDSLETLAMTSRVQDILFEIIRLII